MGLGDKGRSMKDGGRKIKLKLSQVVVGGKGDK